MLEGLLVILRVAGTQVHAVYAPEVFFFHVLHLFKINTLSHNLSENLSLLQDKLNKHRDHIFLILFGLSRSQPRV